MPSQFEYSQYLRQRTMAGSLYRKHFLYPRICKLLRGSMLDVGCGIGDMLKFYPGAIGIDVNSYNVDFCRKSGLEAFVMPFDQLPFGDQIFDSILLDNVLEHIVDPTRLLAEIKRVLRSDGVLVIGVPGLKGQAADLDHKVYYNEAALETLAKKLGFRVNGYMYAPLFRSSFLSQTLTRYGIYTQWQKID